MTDKAVCDELGISTRQFKRWRDELALLGKDAFPGSGFSRDQEVSALKRDLALVTKERGFLRQAAAYFARRSRFLNDCLDIRSSYYMEDVATQFDIQGLELDWTGVCWDADFRIECFSSLLQERRFRRAIA